MQRNRNRDTETDTETPKQKQRHRNRDRDTETDTENVRRFFFEELASAAAVRRNKHRRPALRNKLHTLLRGGAPELEA